MALPTPTGPDEVVDSASAAEAIHSTSIEVLLEMCSNPSLTEDLALSLLKRSDLSAECVTALSKNSSIAKYRKVRLAIVEHLHTPRNVSLPMLRLLYTFDLMRVALTPVVPADLKRAAEDMLLAKLETISSGEKLALARRASGRVAARLLLDKEARVMRAALDNPKLAEASIAKVLNINRSSAPLVEAVCRHPKWSLAREIRIALLRNENTPLARALEFARSLSASLLRDILQSSRLPQSIKACLLRQSENKLKAGPFNK